MAIDILSEKPVAELVEAKNTGQAHYPEETRLEAYSLFLQGMRLKDIALQVGASPSTISKWISTYRKRFKDDIEAQTGVDLLSGVLEEYEFLKNFAYSQIRDIMTAVDENGNVIPNPNVNHAVCAKYLDLVKNVIKDKTALFVQTGAIAKEPERLHVNIKGENKSEVKVTITGEDRSPEEIERDILERLKLAKLIKPDESEQTR